MSNISYVYIGAINFLIDNYPMSEFFFYFKNNF